MSLVVIRRKRCGSHPPTAEPRMAERNETVNAALKRNGREASVPSRIATGAIESRNTVAAIPERNDTRRSSSGSVIVVWST